MIKIKINNTEKEIKLRNTRTEDIHKLYSLLNSHSWIIIRKFNGQIFYKDYQCINCLNILFEEGGNSNTYDFGYFLTCEELILKSIVE